MSVRFKLLSSPAIRFSLPVSEDLFDSLSAHLESLNRPIKGLCWVDPYDDRVRLSSSADLAEAVECGLDVVVLDYPETSDDSDSGEDSDAVKIVFEGPASCLPHESRRRHRSRSQSRGRDLSRSRSHSPSRSRLEKRKMRILRRMREGRMKPFGHHRAIEKHLYRKHSQMEHGPFGHRGPFGGHGPFGHGGSFGGHGHQEHGAFGGFGYHHGPFGGFPHRGPHGPFGEDRHGPEGLRGFFGGRGPRGDKYYHQGLFGCPGRRLGH